MFFRIKLGTFCQDDPKKSKRMRKSDSASTSPDIRNKENGLLKPSETLNMKDANENLSDLVKNEVDEDLNKEMEQTNPAFLKYLQYKVCQSNSVLSCIKI